MQAQILDATPTKNSDGSIAWTLCHHQGAGKSCGNQPGSYPAVSVDKADQPFKITITGDQTDLGIKFASDPMWMQWNAAKTGGSWTTKPTGPDGGQIIGVQGAGTQVLQFRDTNSDEGVITYQLNFVDKNNNKVNPLDPDIRNGGGNVPPPPPPPPGATTWGSESSAVLITAAVISALVAAIVAYIVVRLMRPRGP